jgi:hypothetical protein
MTTNSWLVLGDSHIECIGRAVLDWPARIVSVGGATAIGLRNPRSLTNAVNEFRAAALPAIGGGVPVLHLGEVDCGFVIWWRALKHGEPVCRQLADSVAAHLAFADELLERYSVAVLTAPSPPTILDGANWGKVANERREVTASLTDRTQLTLDYAGMIREGAAQRSVPFIDHLPTTLDPITGVVAAEYRNPNPLDHHIDPDKSAALWADSLNELSRNGLRPLHSLE